MKSNLLRILEEINKKAMPHVLLKNKGDADLYFEFLELPERREFFEDLTSKDQPTITLPDFGHIGDFDIVNPDAKEINETDLLRGGEEFIERFVNKGDSPHPFLEYDKNKHKYKLKPKYDLEKIIKEIVSRN